MYHDPAIISVLNSKDYSLKLLLGILNSRLASFYHFNNSPKATKGSFPKLLVDDVRQFPLKRNTKIENHIIKLVDQILQKKNRNPDVDTSDPERQIDLQVYHLYNLTLQEVQLIDSSVTEAEWNK
jgi:adenine-specific DNA-methyltransferase